MLNFSCGFPPRGSMPRDRQQRSESQVLWKWRHQNLLVLIVFLFSHQEERTSDVSLEIVMAHNPEPLTETSVVKFKNQDFRSLRDRCLSRGQLFIDDTFPTEASSIGQKLLKGKHLSKLEWKRPQVSEPRLGTQQSKLCAFGSCGPWCLLAKRGPSSRKPNRKKVRLSGFCATVLCSVQGMGRLCAQSRSLDHCF